MISTSDLLKILDKIPLWKRISSLPDKYASLEKRVIELENKIKYTPGTCPSCTSSNFGVESMRRGEQKPNLRKFACQDCGYSEIRTI